MLNLWNINHSIASLIRRKELKEIMLFNANDYKNFNLLNRRNWLCYFKLIKLLLCRIFFNREWICYIRYFIKIIVNLIWFYQIAFIFNLLRINKNLLCFISFLWWWKLKIIIILKVYSGNYRKYWLLHWKYSYKFIFIINDDDKKNCSS